MQTEEIIGLIQTAIPNAVVEIGAEGNHLNLKVISDAFEGLRPVKRQQMVYGALNALIADGTVHAVNMQTFTAAEAA
jgi:acid stress-induced BolA-like protein IbaG/YrbA